MIRGKSSQSAKHLKYNITYPVGLDVAWQKADDCRITDAHLKNWLLDTGSLTERLQAHCRHFSLALLGQQQLIIDEQERHHLQCLPEQHHWQVREVILSGDDTPWVFARSILPQALCEAQLAGLGTKPLGQLIFNDRDYQRSAFEICQISLPHPLHTLSNGDSSDILWGRRSRFTFAEHQMSVAEVFLPGAPAYKQLYE